ncbi:helix-turn-helix transcriptional regulator [Xanthobacter autotrophicus]|uniref:helix-turn-helix transcriptional regulator n=1 Tax=Xanthobacter TaxID=279 RepID=UPI0024AA2511|nr:helix-turn-helix transcriptional regulator [Xanthobacter autotrophicus]MDI4664219.1 helix-turn-helix transcriptional regulator [Xanthobacter autotrophicus]
MSDFLTTRELAALLRVKERKVYDLVAAGSLPVRRVTGKLLFPRKEIESWIGGAGEARAAEDAPAASEHSQPPLILAGGHDPLLEWALRESRSGIAAFFDGALDGLQRAERGECIAVGLHVPEPDGWNVGAVEGRFRREPWVLIEWARRVRGLIYRPDIARPPSCLKDVRGLRFQSRQPEAGSELVLDRLLSEEKMKRADLRPVKAIERTETDLALAISTGRADVGLGIEAAARLHNLRFLPLLEERFDLLVWRKSYFDPPFQKLVTFCHAPAFAARAADLGGYDISGFGTVRYNCC